MNAATRSELAVLGDMPRSLTIPEDELINTLRASLYAGAADNSIRLVIGYCKAQGLDPMQKPVHIVPMKVSTGKKDAQGWDIKETRDVIMPGVGLYRTQAARTGAYAGVSDPEFGPTKTLAFSSEHWEGDRDQGTRRKVRKDETIEYPEWCRVSVTRIVDGRECVFPAREYWLENYATKGSDSAEPNAMWKKRPFGQIAKCAEAQALRKGFPEIGSQPTAEEMEGKFIDAEDLPHTPEGRKPAVTMPQPKAKPAATEGGDVTDVQPKGDQHEGGEAPLATVGEIAYITKKITGKGMTIAEARAAAQLEPSETLEGLTKDGFVALKDALA